MTFFSNVGGFNLQPAPVNQKCAICHKGFRPGANAFYSEELNTRYHQTCAKTTQAFKDWQKFEQEDWPPLSDPEVYSLPYVSPNSPFGRKLYDYDSTGNNILSDSEDSSGVRGSRSRSISEDSDSDASSGIPEGRSSILSDSEDSDPEDSSSVRGGGRSRSISEASRSSQVEGRSSEGFLYRNRFKIAAIAVGLTVAAAIGLEYIRRTTTETFHDYCLVPNNDNNTLYCTIKNVFANAASQMYEKTIEYTLYRRAGEPALSYDEVPAHDQAPARELASWTTNAIQRLWTRYFG